MLLSGLDTLAKLAAREVFCFISGCFGLICTKKYVINLLQHAPEKSFHHNLMFDADAWKPIVGWQVICLWIYCDTKINDANFSREAQRKPEKILWSVQVIGFIVHILFWKLSVLIESSKAHYFSSGNNSWTVLVIDVSPFVLYCVLLCSLWGTESLIFIVAMILNLSLTFLPEFKGIVIMITALCFYMLLSVSKVSNRDRILATGVLEIALMLFFASPFVYAAAFVRSFKAGIWLFIGWLIVVLAPLCTSIVPTAVIIIDHVRTMITFALLLQSFVVMVALQLS